MKKMFLIFLVINYIFAQDEIIKNWEDFIPYEDAIELTKDKNITPTKKNIAIINTIYKINKDENKSYLLNKKNKNSFYLNYKIIHDKCQNFEIFFAMGKVMLEKYGIKTFDDRIKYVRDNESGYFMENLPEKIEDINPKNCYITNLEINYNTYKDSIHKYKRVLKHQLNENEFLAIYKFPYIIDEYFGTIILSNKNKIINKTLENMNKQHILNKNIFVIVKPKKKIMKWNFQNQQNSITSLNLTNIITLIYSK